MTLVAVVVCLLLAYFTYFLVAQLILLPFALLLQHADWKIRAGIGGSVSSVGTVFFLNYIFSLIFIKLTNSYPWWFVPIWALIPLHFHKNDLVQHYHAANEAKFEPIKEQNMMLMKSASWGISGVVFAAGISLVVVYSSTAK